MMIGRFMIICAAGFALFAVGRGLTLRSAAPPRPRLVITPTEADLGAVPVGRAVERVFELRNAGDARLLVTGVSSTCQCTVADLPTRTLAPGESVELRVTFRATRPGPKSQRVVVRTNDPLEPTHVLAVRAIATPVATTRP